MQNKISSYFLLILVFLIFFDTFYFINLNLNIIPKYYLGNNPVIFFPIIFLISLFLIIRDFKKYFITIFDEYTKYYFIILILFIFLYIAKDFLILYENVIIFQKKITPLIILEETKFIRPLIFFFWGAFFLKQIIKYLKLDCYQLLNIFFIAVCIDLILKVIFYFNISLANLNQLDFVNSLLPCFFGFVLATSLNNISNKIYFFLFVFGFSLFFFSNSKFFILLMIITLMLKYVRFSFNEYLLIFFFVSIILFFFPQIVLILDNFINKFSDYKLDFFTNTNDEMAGYGMPNSIISIMSRINTNTYLIIKLLSTNPLYGLSFHDLDTKILGYSSHSLIVIILCYAGFLGSSIILLCFVIIYKINSNIKTKIYSLGSLNSLIFIFFLFFNDIYIFLSLFLILNEKSLFKK